MQQQLRSGQCWRPGLTAQVLLRAGVVPAATQALSERVKQGLTLQVGGLESIQREAANALTWQPVSTTG